MCGFFLSSVNNNKKRNRIKIRQRTNGREMYWNASDTTSAWVGPRGNRRNTCKRLIWFTLYNHSISLNVHITVRSWGFSVRPAPPERGREFGVESQVTDLRRATAVPFPFRIVIRSEMRKQIAHCCGQVFNSFSVFHNSEALYSISSICYQVVGPRGRRACISCLPLISIFNFPFYVNFSQSRASSE